MKQFRNRVIGIAMLLTLAAVGVLMTAYPGGAQNRGNPNPGPDVTIVGPLPLPVTGPQDPALQPFAHQFNLSFPQPGGGSIAEESIIVPAGKRLVIETVSTRGFLAVGDKADFMMDVFTAGVPVRYSFEPTFIGTFFTLDRWVGSESVRIYADPGSSVRAIFQKNSITVVGGGNFSISGHLVDLQ